MKRVILTALLLASCGQRGNPDIFISDAWARETVAHQGSTAAYMTITNRGAGEDRLLGVSATAPVMAMLHESASGGGISSMRPVEGGMPIYGGASLALKPLGDHVMITGLTKRLRPGDKLPLELKFERSGTRKVDVRIVKATEEGPK